MILGIDLGLAAEADAAWDELGGSIPLEDPRS
jgi:hypothetical protein